MALVTGGQSWTYLEGPALQQGPLPGCWGLGGGLTWGSQSCFLPAPLSPPGLLPETG